MPAHDRTRRLRHGRGAFVIVTWSTDFEARVRAVTAKLPAAQFGVQLTVATPSALLMAKLLERVHDAPEAGTLKSTPAGSRPGERLDLSAGTDANDARATGITDVEISSRAEAQRSRADAQQQRFKSFRSVLVVFQV